MIDCHCHLIECKCQKHHNAVAGKKCSSAVTTQAALKLSISVGGLLLYR